MIRYSLRCEQDHGFEGWFRTSDDYDRQAAGGLLTCAQCGSSHIEKALMAPSIATSEKRIAAATAIAAEPAQKAMTAQSFGSGMPPEFVDMARKLRALVRENAEYVGPKFAEEARRIHYEESEPRGIYGEATPQEAKELREEGIDAHALPAIPEDAN